MVEFKVIDNYSNYIIKNNGECWNIKRNKKLKLRYRRRYYSVVLYNKDGCKNFSIHRLVAKYFVPNINNKPFVNHIDLNRKNNSFENLEWVTSRENTHHYIKTKHTSSSYVGISWYKNYKKWLARISIGKNRKFLGYFDTEKQAVIAYNNALKEVD